MMNPRDVAENAEEEEEEEKQDTIFNFIRSFHSWTKNTHMLF